MFNISIIKKLLMPHRFRFYGQIIGLRPPTVKNDYMLEFPDAARIAQRS